MTVKIQIKVTIWSATSATFQVLSSHAWLSGSQLVWCRHRAFPSPRESYRHCLRTAVLAHRRFCPRGILVVTTRGIAAGIVWAGDRDAHILSQGNNGHFGRTVPIASLRPLPGARTVSSQALTCLSAAQLMTARAVAATCPTCWAQEPHWGAEKAAEAQKRKVQTFGIEPHFLFPFGENHALRRGPAGWGVAPLPSPTGYPSLR